MILASTSLRTLRARVVGLDAPKRPRAARAVAAPFRWIAEAIAPVARPVAEPRRAVAQTPWTGRCACGECGGIALLPVGTVLSWRGRSVRVAAWAPQDHWNVPCMDAEGAVGISRDSLDGGSRFTVDDAHRAARRTSELAIGATDKDERARLVADRDAWCDLARRLAAGDAAGRLNPTNHVGAP